MKCYKTSEASKELKCTVATVKAEIERGRLKAFKVGSEYRISQQALDAYMELIINGFKTENEIRLEEENARLKKQLEIVQNKLLNITAVIIETA